jgi:hypothetical protein
MNLRLVRIVPVCFALLGGVCSAADPAATAAPTVGAKAGDYRPSFDHLGTLVSALSRGDIDTAFQHYAERLIDPPPKEIGEFESDQRSAFRRHFERFPKNVESLDLMAVRPLSSRSLKLTCIANTRTGPVMIETITYRFGDDWWYCQLGWQHLQAMDASRLKSFEELLPAKPLAEPVSLPIRGDAPERVSATKR